MAGQRLAGMRTGLLVFGGVVSIVGLVAAGLTERPVGAEAVAQAKPATQPESLAIGSAAPDFSLPGTDGKTYSLASFKDSKALAVIFTAVHCPTA